MKRLITLLAALIMVATTEAQDRILTMEDAVLGYHLRPESRYIQWKGDEPVFTYIQGKELIGESVHGEKSVLMTTDRLNHLLGTALKGWPEYRWTDSNTLMLQVEGSIVLLDAAEGKLIGRYAIPARSANLTYNGKGLFAYTRDNNLYYMDANSNEFAVTGSKDPDIVYGQSVSRNEFGISGGIFWSPDGKKLGFYRKDESQVGTFPLLDINTRTGSLKQIKYPMAGMKSEHISLGIHDIALNRTVFVKADDFGREQYLTNIAWDPSSEHVYIKVLDRAQKHMKLNKYKACDGSFEQTLLEEKSDKYVEPLTPITFLKDDPGRFIHSTSNRDRYLNLYLVDAGSGEILQRITDVEADVSLVAQDGRYVYYTSAEISPVDNHLFRADLKTGKKTRLTHDEGWHNITMSKDCRFFIDQYSALKVPNVIRLADREGKTVKEILRAEDPSSDYNYGEIILGSVKSADGKYDNYYRLIQPMDFDPSKKYPTIVYVYGGPHSQMVQNTWQGQLRRWEMYMAQHGYVVFVMDNRGTQNRGLEFEQAIHGQCGQAEMADQMKGIDFLLTLPYVDKDRIGVHGWSYGGFMTISLMTNHPEIFKVGVAGGPVIDWKWYEIMYGERYMDSPHTNAAGYAKTSLIGKAKDLKGKLLICQGAVDNTVVWEHSLSFIRECIKNNVQVDYFPYPCAEHNVRGKDRIHLMQKVTDYFEDYLK